MEALSLHTFQALTHDLFRYDSRTLAELSTTDFQDYHGFKKVTLPSRSLEQTVCSYGIKPEAIQAEIVRVDTDLTSELHQHMNARAFCTILGNAHGFPDPRGGMAHLSGKWFPVEAGDHILIPSETVHGFTVQPGGILYFLSLQSPPIERPGQPDDYVCAAVESLI